MPHLDWTINVPTLAGWLIAGGTVIWRLSALVTVLTTLVGDFRAHEGLDEARHQDTQKALRDLALARSK